MSWRWGWRGSRLRRPAGWLPVARLVSLGRAPLIAYGAWGIGREPLNLRTGGTPRLIDVASVTAEITSTPRITDMHDLHVWALASDETALSVRVVVGDCP